METCQENWSHLQEDHQEACHQKSEESTSVRWCLQEIHGLCLCSIKVINRKNWCTPPYARVINWHLNTATPRKLSGRKWMENGSMKLSIGRQTQCRNSMRDVAFKAPLLPTAKWNILPSSSHGSQDRNPTTVDSVGSMMLESSLPICWRQGEQDGTWTVNVIASSVQSVTHGKNPDQGECHYGTCKRCMSSECPIEYNNDEQGI